jgi:hypothetical protein
MSRDGVVDTLAYRLTEMYDFMRNLDPKEIVEPTIWEAFVNAWQGEEAEEWFDDYGDPIKEWDGIWHTSNRRFHNALDRATKD